MKALTLRSQGFFCVRYGVLKNSCMGRCLLDTARAMLHFGDLSVFNCLLVLRYLSKLPHVAVLSRPQEEMSSLFGGKYFAGLILNVLHMVQHGQRGSFRVAIPYGFEDGTVLTVE